MEAKFNEIKMKLTKDDLVKELGMAIQTIESKDAEINKIKARSDEELGKAKALNESISAKKREIQSELRSLQKVDSVKVINENKLYQEQIKNKDKTINDLQSEINELKKLDHAKVLKENAELRANQDYLVKESNEMVKMIGQLLDTTEIHLKLIQTANDSHVNVYDMLKKSATAKWGKKEKENR